MVILYPRPYRPALVEVAWRTWRDMHPKPMAGYDPLPVTRDPWWRNIVGVRRGFVFLNVGVGVLSVWWRTGEA